jgi:hypothetical protein
MKPASWRIGIMTVTNGRARSEAVCPLELSAVMVWERTQPTAAEVPATVSE